MKNQNFAEKIKELRNIKGLSQEQLSELSKVSIRTIQRIENGKNIPTGDTLNRIAGALDATIDGLIINDKKEDIGYLSLITLSAISYILHPFLGLLLPLVFWYIKRNKILDADEVGRKLISFQITWQLAFFIYLIVTLHGISILQTYNNSISDWGSFYGRLGSPKTRVTISIFYFFNLFMILVNLILLQLRQRPRYILSIPFMWMKKKQ